MQVLDGQLVLSASDLNNFLACGHLTTLDLARARGEIEAPSDQGADVELLARKGDEHEARYLASLRDEGLEVAEIPFPADGSRAALEAAAAQTEEALRAGPDVIYQATFFRDGLRGHADFLFRVDRPSDLGDYSYEVADTKLARRAKPYFILQLCFYSELLAAAQGVEPERIHVILGSGEQHSFRLAEFSAYFRRVRDGFLAELDDPGRDTYPEPVSHCSICRWRSACDERRVADDHLSLVAGISRRQRDLLRAAGFDTLAALGSAGQLSARGIGVDVLERLHEQASLQLGARETGEHAYLLLAPQEARGFARLPRPSPGDVFFDMEGDPFFDGGGLEYLFGLITADGERPEFTAIWGRDRAEEKRALEEFVDLIVARRRRFGDLHVYHYAGYEITALKRLAGAHGTREEELDQLLRDEVFVDLYKVVREAMRISQPSYSIKKVEAFYMDARDTAVTDGGDSMVMFERWLEEGEGSILDEIAAYNEDDCLSTLRLRDWLLERRAEAEREFEGAEEARWIEWFEAEPGERGEEALAIQEENEALMAALLDEGAEPLDYLFIDEAGQVSLADALALSTAARNVVALGDPQQLPQVAGAAHPEGSSLSVLEHLLGERQTVDPAGGVFLEQTWRLHPDVCAFVSELMYDGRLRSAPGRERQRIDAEGELTGTGLRWLPVEHEGHSQSSEEEADRIAKAIEPLLNGATYTDDEGNQKPLQPSDILVVTPYNAQVKCLQDRLPSDIRIGTVDKFQGQEAQVVFFSMATSSSEEIPRNVEFLFSRNRLNVAISRAKCLAVLVCNPRLLDIHATSIEQMRLVNALCRLAELATLAPQDPEDWRRLRTSGAG
jgi:predicted RecB family nuclease